jgi:hypothetical protein
MTRVLIKEIQIFREEGWSVGGEDCVLVASHMGLMSEWKRYVPRLSDQGLFDQAGYLSHHGLRLSYQVRTVHQYGCDT